MFSSHLNVPNKKYKKYAWTPTTREQVGSFKLRADVVDNEDLCNHPQQAIEKIPGETVDTLQNHRNYSHHILYCCIAYFAVVKGVEQISTNL